MKSNQPNSPQWEKELHEILVLLVDKESEENIRYFISSLINAEWEAAVREFETKFRAYWNGYALKWQESNPTQPVKLIVRSTNRLLDQLVEEERGKNA